MTDFLNWLNGEIIWGPPLIALIIITGVYVTVRSGFFQVRHLGYIFKRTLGCILRKDHVQDENDKGLLSPYEAIATAVGGSVGFGNIAGVATAVTTGGPGAVLWMWLTAFIGMLIKQVEVTLAVYYRRTDEEGNPYGGPTYYMEYGLGEERHWGKKWLPLAFIFGLGIFSTFFISASNFTTSEVLAQSFGVKQELASLMLVIFIYALIWRGVKNLSKIFVKLVPVMSLGYMLFGILIIILNIGNLVPTIASIFTNAFTGTAAMGGFAGVTVSKAIATGMQRSVYSNEAGWGTSPMVHASSKTRHPVEQGLWGSFEVFVDTFIVCTITALSVLITGEWTSGATNATLALNVFQHSLGSFGTVFMTATMVIFSVTTSGGWYVYYEVTLRHLAKDHPVLKKWLLMLFKYFYALPPFLLTLYLINVGDLSIWTLVDITSGMEYTVLEQPQPPEQGPEEAVPKCAQPKQAEPKREKPVQENPAQLNTKEINKEETNNVSNPIRAAGQRTEYRALLLKNIEYPILAQNNPMDTMRLDELVELMLDVVCSKRAAIRISGEEMPAEVVKSRFLKLGAEHIQYVLDCLKDNPPRIRNIKQYLLAALYNAPLTIENYYAAQIDHDLCGGKR